MCLFAVHNAASELVKVTNKHAHSKHCQTSMPAFTRSKLTIETIEQGVKYVQS